MLIRHEIATERHTVADRGVDVSRPQVRYVHHAKVGATRHHAKHRQRLESRIPGKY